MTDSNYNAQDIQVLQGLDAVRMRPGMYIGSTGAKGLHHLLWEIVDNAVDEAINGYADKISIKIHPDNSITVEDNGRGIPVDIHPQMKISGVEVVFTQLHAGGKFNNDKYSYSGGLHGVGASVVNALSEWLEVEVYRNGNIYYQRFESYYDKNKNKVVSGKPVTPLKIIGQTDKNGTKISFKPDSRVFEVVEMNHDLIDRRIREIAFLNKGLKIIMNDERDDYAESEYKYNGGLIDFVKYMNEDKNPVHQEPIYFEGTKDDIFAAIAIQYTDSYTENIFSYVNDIPTTEGGTHETGFKSAITKVMNDFAKKTGLLKEKDALLTGEDFREGMTAIIAVKMKNIQFEGQTKTKLGNSEARTALESIVSDKLTQYMFDNSELSQLIVEKAIKAANVREAARKAKEITRKKNSIEDAPLVGKLASCSGRDFKKNELLIVEGDSAGGSAKQGRDRKFQAILPLRGKPLNAEKKRLDQVLANEEFRTLISALGTGIDQDFKYENLKYGKIIILADADQDGAHIRAILLTFFYRYMRRLLQEGNVYIGLSPLYKVIRGSYTGYAYDEKQLNEDIKKAGKGYTVQRFKGLGEMNPEQLWETTLDPANRILIQVTVDDAAEAERMVTVLMGDKVDPRRNYICKYANFSKQDNFDNYVK